MNVRKLQIELVSHWNMLIRLLMIMIYDKLTIKIIVNIEYMENN